MHMTLPTVPCSVLLTAYPDCISIAAWPARQHASHLSRTRPRLCSDEKHNSCQDHHNNLNKNTEAPGNVTRGLVSGATL